MASSPNIRRDKRDRGDPFRSRGVSVLCAGPAAWKLLSCLCLAAVFTLLAVSPGYAVALNLGSASAEYLLVGTGDQGVIGTSAAVSNFELGANSVAVPMGGLSVPALPSNAAEVVVGIGENGDIAITHSNGNIGFSNINIHGDTGVDCAGTLATCNTGISNTNYNGNPLTAANGLNGSVDLSALSLDIATAKVDIPALASSYTLDFSDDGKWDSDLVIDLVLGITVIDIDAGGNDLLLEGANLVFDGPAGAFAIVRMPGDANFTVTQSNIIIGDGGIEYNNVLFFSDKADNNQHFNFNNTILNGVAFWDLGMSGGEITLNNAQGCTQLIGDKINLNDVRLNNCGFTAVPEPSSGLLVGLGLVTLGTASRGQRKKRYLSTRQHSR